MKRLSLGLIVALALVVGSNLLTWRTTGLSYDQFTWAVYAGPMIYPETEDEVPGGCSDGIDNDMDEDVDCADSDCADNIVCNAPAPALSGTGIALMMALLLLVGWFGVARRSRFQE